jgi:hypothetical protein
MEALALDPLVAGRMMGWLDRYEEALRMLLASTPEGAAQTAVDACFAALRLQQRARWPAGAAWVDRLGLDANALIIAWSENGLRGDRVARAREQHDRCAARLREVLAAARAAD